MTDVWDEQLLWYARAVRAMQGRPESDPTSWLFQANIHGTRSASDNPEWNNCPHGGWFFLPWHRAYILCFEGIVRDVIQNELGGPNDWALPYWNYTRVTNGNPNSPESLECRRLPSAFRSPDWPDGEADNPLFLAEPKRSPGAAGGLPVEWAEVNPHAAMQAPHFTGVTQFGSADTDSQLLHRSAEHDGLLEMQPHDLIHGYVGGVMLQFISPQDPIFWLHHCQIDRLWAAWIASNSGHRNPTEADWLGFTHTFRNAQGNQVGFTSEELQSEEALGYVYESLTDGVGLKPPERLVAMMEAGVDPPAEKVASTTGPTDLGPDTLTVPLTPEPSARAEALPEAASPNTESRAILTMDDVRADAPPQTNYRVFVGARPDHEEDLDPEGPYFIGHLHFFGAVGASTHHHGGSGLTFKFDITEHLTELRQLGMWNGEGIPPVVVTPATLGPPPPDAEAEAVARAAAPTPPPESRPRIGSISLATT
ncbi:tyrosinase family protein [Streptomyces sp. NBC_01235]|uniref:tyrosinase family protein n=1 Tax=Streptomyces sp. NBC_01235 TaxID=2903788 RepID=UPI002E109D60|nr:tyrosinase family protein [Streptomyces sp. NBC_01235]